MKKKCNHRFILVEFLRDRKNNVIKNIWRCKRCGILNKNSIITMEQIECGG